MTAEDFWIADKTEESSDEEIYAPRKYEIINYPADTTLKGYFEQWKSSQIYVPDFQRRYVWDIKKASKLIESFLLGLPVPGVFLYKNRSDSSFQIIDGQQRIMSAVYFLMGEFEDETVFRLRGVQPEWEGKRYTDLTEADRFKLDNSVLRATIIQQLDPHDDTSIYLIFERLNTGGVNLNAMEIRRSVCYGNVVHFLDSLNSNRNWRRIIGVARPDKRFRDVELILRCEALAAGWDHYEKPMKGFLNYYMADLAAHPERYEALAKSFFDATQFVISKLGERPFHLRKRLNYGLMDSDMVAVINGLRPEDIKDRLDALLQNEEFIRAITYNTSDAEEVNRRMHLVSDALR